MVVLNKLREFQDAGHPVVLIIGDYTARVGDPSGRVGDAPGADAPRRSRPTRARYQEQAFKVLDRERTEVRRNSEWLRMPSEAAASGCVRAVHGRPAARARRLHRSGWRRGEPISLLELLYPVLQGYDSVAIEADVELGGTDQKFNLLFGRDVQDAFGQPPQSILTMPILPGTDGVRRMSKSLATTSGSPTRRTRCSGS